EQKKGVEGLVTWEIKELLDLWRAYSDKVDRVESLVRQANKEGQAPAPGEIEAMIAAKQRRFTSIAEELGQRRPKIAENRAKLFRVNEEYHLAFSVLFCAAVSLWIALLCLLERLYFSRPFRLHLNLISLDRFQELRLTLGIGLWHLQQLEAIGAE